MARRRALALRTDVKLLGRAGGMSTVLTDKFLGTQTIVGGYWTETGRPLPAQANGRMFWFMRKKFFGSYLVLSS